MFDAVTPTEAAGVSSAGGEPVGDPAAEGGTARITLRLPEHLKARAEEAAERDGLSVNSWLVRAVAAAVTPRTGNAPGRGAAPRVASASSGGPR